LSRFGPTAAAVAAPTIIPASALGKDGHAPPSERIVVGIVGWGMMGPANTDGLMAEKDCQVIAACDETSRTAGSGRSGSRAAERERVFVESRLQALRSFAAAVDAGIEAFARGEPITPQTMQVIHIDSGRKR